jgi:hypothetical protein
LLTDKPEARALDILRASRGQAATMAGIWLAGSLGAGVDGAPPRAALIYYSVK